MAKLIAVVGPSGSGKSASLRHLPSKETFIISPSKSELPIPGFRKKYNKVDAKGKNGNFYMTKDMKKMKNLMKKVATDEHYAHIKYLIVEDNTHFFNAATLSNGFREAGNDSKQTWSRWGDLGADVYQALFGSSEGFRDDLWIITMFHPETYMTATGEKLKIKTPGTLLEREVDLPSYYTNLLYTKVIPVDKNDPQPASERYKFVTNDDGYHPAKTVMDAFPELYIENDLAVVLNRLDTLANEE